MKNGRISQAGNFQDLLRTNTGFEHLVGAHTEALESVRGVEISPLIEEKDNPIAEPILQKESNFKRKRISQEEERKMGRIGRDVYWVYLTAVNSGALIPIILASQSLFQAFQVAGNYWIALTSPPSREIITKSDLYSNFLVYVILSTCGSLFMLLRAMLVAIAGIKTAQKLFEEMLERVMRAPMRFFDSTPVGRILNRVKPNFGLDDEEFRDIDGEVMKIAGFH